MAKHTEGPWSVEVVDGAQAENGEQLLAVCASAPGQERAILVTCNLWQRRDNPESLANARLIAAAPDLLAACQAMLEANYMPDSTMAIAVTARAAIAKATT